MTSTNNEGPPLNAWVLGGAAAAPVPAPVTPVAPARQDGYPNTYAAEVAAAGGVIARPQVFDPALQHYPRAFRLGDPVFADPEAGRRWAVARRRAVYQVLRAVARPPLVDHLVLRGSLPLKAWLGDLAREPGDVDWVAQAPAAPGGGDVARRLFDRLVGAVALMPSAGAGVEVLAKDVRLDDLWAYTRVPGRRAVFPWRADGLPGGVVQVDVAFGEPILAPPVWTSIRASDGGAVSLWAAGPAQALAWKLLWLETDFDPQGKDLFDAVLLAERTALTAELLARTFAAAREPAEPLTAAAVLAWRVDWENFRREYPWVEGDARAWQARLAAALAPTFAWRNGGGNGGG